MAKIKHSHIVATALLVIVIVGGVLWEARSTDASAAPSLLPVVSVATVERSAIDNTVTIAGEFRPWQEVDLHAKVAGYIRKINVDVGDRVRSGQEIALLEIPELTAQITGAEANIRRSQQAILRAQSDVARATSSYSAAHFAYTRLRGAADSRPGLIAEQELDNAQARDRETSAQVAGAEAALAEAQQQLDIAKATQTQLVAEAAYAHITAPFEGVVTKRYADRGSLIQAGTSSNTQAMPVVRIAQIGVMRLEIPVPESAVNGIRAGDTVQAHVSALNRTFTAKVSRCADSVDQQTRTMLTEIDVPNPDGRIVVGMYAHVDLPLAHKDSVLTLPLEAITRNGNEAKVWVLDAQDRAQERAVQLGIAGNENAEITSGLNEKDRVIVGSRGQFRSGEQVQPKPFVRPKASDNGGQS